MGYAKQFIPSLYVIYIAMYKYVLMYVLAKLISSQAGDLGSTIFLCFQEAILLSYV